MADLAVATPHAKYTTRNTRLKVQTLRGVGWKYETIAKELNLTLRQVQHAVNYPPTPTELEAIIEWITHSKEGRRC